MRVGPLWLFSRVFLRQESFLTPQLLPDSPAEPSASSRGSPKRLDATLRYRRYRRRLFSARRKHGLMIPKKHGLMMVKSSKWRFFQIWFQYLSGVFFDYDFRYTKRFSKKCVQAPWIVVEGMVNDGWITVELWWLNHVFHCVCWFVWCSMMFVEVYWFVWCSMMFVEVYFFWCRMMLNDVKWCLSMFNDV